jgi:hypothetical protein
MILITRSEYRSLFLLESVGKIFRIFQLNNIKIKRPVLCKSFYREFKARVNRVQKAQNSAIIPLYLGIFKLSISPGGSYRLSFGRERWTDCHAHRRRKIGLFSTACTFWGRVDLSGFSLDRFNGKSSQGITISSTACSMPP